MTRAFLYGPLGWPDLAAEIAGAPLRTEPATLPGMGLARDATDDWPVLVAGPGVEGWLTAPLGEETLARLDFFNAAIGHVRRAEPALGPDVVVFSASGHRPARDPWTFEEWKSAHGERTRLAAQEVMRLFGSVPVELAPTRLKVAQARAQAVMSGREWRRPASRGGTTPSSAVRVDGVAHVYDGFHRVEEWSLDHPRFDGTRSGPISRAISHVTDAITVLPYDPVRDRVLLVEQIRIGALAKGDQRPWLLEPVAGLIDAGETAESAALREMAEEAGLWIGAGDLRWIGRYYPSPGGVAQVLHSYAALCDLPDAAAGLHGLEEEGEDIRAHLVPFDELLGMLDSGEAANAPLIVSAQWLALNRDDLRGAVG